MGQNGKSPPTSIAAGRPLPYVTYNSAEAAEDVPALNLSVMKQHLSGGPSLSEVSKSALGERLRTLKWFSLFKKYELTIVVTNDTDEAVVFRVKSGE